MKKASFVFNFLLVALLIGCNSVSCPYHARITFADEYDINNISIFLEVGFYEKYSEIDNPIESLPFVYASYNKYSSSFDIENDLLLYEEVGMSDLYSYTKFNDTYSYSFKDNLDFKYTFLNSNSGMFLIYIGIGKISKGIKIYESTITLSYYVNYIIRDSKVYFSK